VRLLLWRALDWYSHRFNDCWGFPTSCLIAGPTQTEEGICHAIHSNHRYLAFFPKAFAENISKEYPYCDKILFAAYIGILPIWFQMFSLKLDLWFISFSLLFFMMIALVRNSGKVNLPYILAKLSIIDRHDVHHGAAPPPPILTNFCLGSVEQLFHLPFQASTWPHGPIFSSSASWPS
jgi:hypothetical protein